MISALRRLRREDCCELKASMGHKETLSQTKNSHRSWSSEGLGDGSDTECFTYGKLRI